MVEEHRPAGFAVDPEGAAEGVDGGCAGLGAGAAVGDERGVGREGLAAELGEGDGARGLGGEIGDDLVEGEGASGAAKLAEVGIEMGEEGVAVAADGRLEEELFELAEVVGEIGCRQG